MADEVTSRVIEIRANYADAVRGISEYMAKLEEAKEAERALKDAIKESGVTTAEDRKQIAALKEAQKEYTKGIQTLSKEIQNNIKVQEQKEGSLVSLRAELINATRAYDELSEAERNGAQGQELATHINQITDKLKAAEEGTQRFYRNVGNYKNSIIDAVSAGNPFVKQLLQMTVNSSSVSGGMKNAGTAVKGFGQQLKALMANPIVALLAGIAAAIGLVKKAAETFNKTVKSSENLTNRWNAVMAPLNRAMTAFQKVLQKACGLIISMAEGAQTLMLKLGNLLEKLPVIGKAIKQVNDANKEAIALAQENADIQKQQRENDEQSAKDRAEIARLRNEAQDKENYTAEQRLEKLQRAADLEKDELKRNQELAARRLAALEAEAKQSENSTEMEDKLKEARIASYNAETDYYTGVRRIENQMRDARKEMAAEQEAQEAERTAAVTAATKAEEEAERQRQAAAKERAAQEKAELADYRAVMDARIAAIRDATERETAAENESYQRQVADLQSRLNEEATLSENQRAYINEQIELLTAAHEAKIAEIQAAAQAERDAAEAGRQAAEIESAKTTLSLRLQLAEKGSAEELELRKQQVQMEMDERLADETLTDEQIALLRQLYQTQMLAMDAKFYQDEQTARIKAKEAAIRIETQKMTAIAGVFKSLASIADQFADDNKAAAIASKVLALGEISVETGVAIAKGVSDAMSAGPFPYNLAAIAATVATILANIATAISTVKGASFSTGGYVSGAGTGTSDSIQARLSNGESVNTALATAMFAPLYSALNQIGGGQAYSGGGGAERMGEDVLSRAFARGAAMIRPTVAVSEIRRVSDRVDLIESIGRA